MREEALQIFLMERFKDLEGRIDSLREEMVKIEKSLVEVEVLLKDHLKTHIRKEKYLVLGLLLPMVAGGVLLWIFKM
jgi:predicted  nucleic acid-binding Zn-ribbon protein